MFKVSIIIPAYNTDNCINRTLQSVENQTFKNYEIIIINDGSTDGTKIFLDTYKIGKNNVIIYHQFNQGVSVARNKGIELATGEFICFLDSDDTYQPNFLEEMLKKQKETRGKVIYCGFNQIRKFGDIEKKPNLFQNGNILKFYYETSNFIHFSCILVDRCFLLENKIDFEVGRKVSEDVLFTVKLFNSVSVYAVEQYLFNYFYRENSVINSDWDDENWASDINGNKKVFHYLNDKYNGLDKAELLSLVRFRIMERETAFLYEKLLMLRLKTIKNYVNSSDLKNIFIECKNRLSKGNRKKTSYIVSNNYITLFYGWFYYKFIRFNFKSLLKTKKIK